MVSNNKTFKKQIVKNKMKSVICYGIIFLISTVAYYFVSTSKAQNVMKLEAFIIDKNESVEATSYEQKVAEDDGEYTIKLPFVQNGFVVKKYTIISKEEYDKLTKKDGEETIAEITEVTEDEKDDSSKQVEKIENKDGILIEEIETATSTETLKKDEVKLEENKEEPKPVEVKTETKEKTDEEEVLEYEPNEEIKLDEEIVNNKAIYLLAEYDKKVEKSTDLYNKIISQKTASNSIIVSGYMPQNATLIVDEVDTQEVENKINQKLDNNIKLKIAYDIKIAVDEEEYEPYEFDEKIKVEITEKDKNINIWHLKDDESSEQMIIEKNGEQVKFDTAEFSIYAIEEVEGNVENSNEEGAIKNSNANVRGSDEKGIEGIDNLIKATSTDKELLLDAKDTKAGDDIPVRASSSTVLEINDYNSDYYYYKGKNYTDDLSGTYHSTYTDSNLVQVTINYHGYALADEDNDAMIGRISLATNERQHTVKHIRCLPVQSGHVIVELMDNPFMDKPTGYGFGGWTSSDGTISTNSYTKVQSINITTSADIEVDVYTNWATATVIYLDGANGNDNRDGLTAANAVKTWSTAVSKLSSSNDRERNIIVLCGNMTDGINYQGGSSGTTNSYYTSSTNKALTVTSLYNHTDYRNQVTLSLTDATRGTFTIYNDFQMNHVKINATGYTNGNSTGANINTGGPRLYGYFHNVRLGRGITQSSTATNSVTFTAAVGGNASNDVTNSSAAYRFVVESGKYHSVLGCNYFQGNNVDYAGTVYLILGSDVDRADGHESNDNLSVYYRTTVNSGYGYNGTSGNDMAFLINVKSGEFGVDFFEAMGDTSSSNGYTAGIYVGGFGEQHTSNVTDRSHRYFIMEGGQVCNIIGGIKLYSSYGTSVKTRMYVKAGNVYNIVGGAGRSTTYGDRLIQITGGTIRYSVSGGSNGAYGSTGDGQISNCSTLVYIGGDAQIGTTTTLNGTGIYGVEAGCVLGAGNGKEGVDGCGQVDNSHIVINDSAHILNSVFGGGNFGVVGDSGTSATARIDILGGTIDRNVYGGSNQNNIYGSTTINIKAGQVKGAVYGGSNTSGTVNSTATVNVTGGTLGTSGNTNPVLCGGGKGSSTSVRGNATVNISDADGTVNIYGSAYGGSEQGIIGAATTTITYTRSTTITSGEQYVISSGDVTGYSTVYALTQSGNSISPTTLTTSTEPTLNMEWIITQTSNGYSIQNASTGQYLAYSNGLTLQNNVFNSWTFANNRFYYRSGNTSNYLRYTGGNWTTTTRQNRATTLYLYTYTVRRNITATANTIVNISDDLTTSAKKVNIAGNVFAGGKGTNDKEAIVTGNSTITVDGLNCSTVNIFGGNDINGITEGDITVNIGQNHSTTIPKVYGGGNEDDTGTEANSVRVYLYSNANVTSAFNGGKSADLLSSSTTDTTRAIYLQGGHATNIFGGSDSLGTVTVSHVNISSGTATNVYGGNNEGGQTNVSNVSVTGGTITNVFGGGYQAPTGTSNVSLTGGTIVNGFGGGNAANVTTSNITLGGSSTTSIYGGSNSSGTVSTSNVTINSGTVTDVYGGNNQGGNTVNTNVTVNSAATNVYGGGNQAQTTGNTNLKLKNATISGAAYGGGNGSTAVVDGNSTTKVEGTTTINGDLFGGGNAAANGTQATQTSNPSIVTTLITGGWIKGDVYGAANTSVVYGNTVVKIGSNAVNDNTMTKGNIKIGGNTNPSDQYETLGTVFGGGKSNLAGSANYDFTFESVTGDANIDIDATGYDNGTHTFEIINSVFGSGNAAKISGDGIVNITNYGTSSNIKNNISIQRATIVTLDNCNIALVGKTDTTNEIATAVYTFNRVDDLRLKNNTTLYLASGMNIVSKMRSLDASGNKETVTIGSNGVANQSVNNRIFLSQGRNIVLRTEAGTDGEVYGMAYVGLYKETSGVKDFGIYGDNYTQGMTISDQVAETFTRNSYVQGKHYNNPAHNIQQDGFYTKYNSEKKVAYDYIIPTPEDAAYYQWIIGERSTDIYYEDIELIATKYATTATYVLSLNGLSYPNMIIDVKGINVSQLTGNITLNDPDTIPSIAATAADADSKFGLTMTTGNNGWQTRGTTYFTYDSQGQTGKQGRLQYLSDNSTTTPTFSLYLAHSKNIGQTLQFGYVTINLEAKYVENDEIKTKNVYIVLKLTTNDTVLMDDYYEGAITPGKEYRIFPTTTTTITKKSSFSAYYSLYINRYSQKQYYNGFTGHYYHTIESSCVLPAGTKITLIDKSSSTVKYYYYIVSSNDFSTNKKVYRFTDFYCMDSEDEHYSADGSYYNSSSDLLFEEYIIHVDFEDTTLTADLEDNNIVVQLRDAYNDSIRLTVNTAMYPMLFSVYDNLEVNASINLDLDKNAIHMGDTVGMDIATTYVFRQNQNSDTVYDTTHIDNQLGVRFTISSGSNALAAANLEGIYITYNGTNYYARSDGTYRIKIADSVSNVSTSMVLHTEVGRLGSGTYTIKAESFGSSDGTYFSTAIAQDLENLQIASSSYGFVVDLADSSYILDKTTGKNKNDSNNLDFIIGYSGSFEHPKVVVSLYRRKYDDVVSYEYEKVNLSQYVTNNLTSTTTQYEYLVTDNLSATQTFRLTTGTNLMSGTYKVKFSLYDGTALITEMDKAIIIK